MPTVTQVLAGFQSRATQAYGAFGGSIPWDTVIAIFTNLLSNCIKPDTEPEVGEPSQLSERQLRRIAARPGDGHRIKLLAGLIQHNVPNPVRVNRAVWAAAKDSPSEDVDVFYQFVASPAAALALDLEGDQNETPSE